MHSRPAGLRQMKELKSSPEGSGLQCHLDLVLPFWPRLGEGSFPRD